MNQVDHQVRALQARGEAVPKDLEMLHQRFSRYQGMALAREQGMDVIFHNAPAVMLFQSSNMATTPKDDCMIAAHTVTLAAMTMGLESCYIGLFNAAARSDPRTQAALGLPEGNTIYSVLILGYPKLKYRKAVDRKPIKVTWA
jgi:nitroreductase